MRRARVEQREPRIPFTALSCERFHADQGFDFICLARSPKYTPAEADDVFDEIRRRFIDERTF
jgi:hypothetical protein